MKKEWIRCPNCNQKLMKHTQDAESKGVFFKCKKCKKEIEINIKN